MKLDLTPRHPPGPRCNREKKADKFQLRDAIQNTRPVHLKTIRIVGNKGIPRN